VLIGRALSANGHGHLWTLEIDAALAARAEERCYGLPVTVVNRSSIGWTPPGLIDFAWHDSLCHLRHEEIAQWSRAKLYRLGAIIGIHDTGPQHDC
jgi:hypothetical protein